MKNTERSGLILLTGLIVALGLAGPGWGCRTAPKLEPGGVYAPTNDVGQVIYNDIGLALADASYKFAYETVTAVLRFEREHRAEIFKLTPDVKHALDAVRPKVVEVDRRWAVARQAYRANPTPAGLSTLQTILSEVQRLVPAVQAELQPFYAQLTTTTP